jgi:hypothetical protein
LCVEPELPPCVHFKNTRAILKFIHIVPKIKLSKPMSLFPPSLRLKEPQAKPTSLQDFWRSHDPRAHFFYFKIMSSELPPSERSRQTADRHPLNRKNLILIISRQGGAPHRNVDGYLSIGICPNPPCTQSNFEETCFLSVTAAATRASNSPCLFTDSQPQTFCFSIPLT